jgi:hypothetical protein
VADGSGSAGLGDADASSGGLEGPEADAVGAAGLLAVSAGAGIVPEPEHADVSSSTTSAADRMVDALRLLTRSA